LRDQNSWKKFRSILLRRFLPLILLLFFFSPQAKAFSFPQLPLGGGGTPQNVSTAIEILLLLTVISLAPAILVTLTSFTRIIVVFSLLRRSMGTMQMPPNQVMIGLALFLTLFVMAPVFNQINDQALKPFLAEKISQQEAYDRGIQPLRDFMLNQTREKDLALFAHFAKIERPKGPSDVPTYVIIPAFIISELKTAFQMGFLIYLPFLIIDMVVASVLMSMGMLMLPPIMISLPFKILLFVMVDGWNLVVRSLIMSFH